ncbi:MAG: single-stranded DNA-binding protein [Candidatus Mcinerneyibacterium aminivorans]|jgi:single-strand DNA-binding protein|uniref:Single-stranded DNA-binding protein n=1 Tax=Candidatus Mcinerneyibacterium aminivorans TaxID=2703815 RepID=A0A5D0MKT9_9BACT|nr:MAG: single-stranded DNA-binding protein [Candidatus Mcinerneyibacterium aminivorans]
MAVSFNKVIIAGNLAKDPELNHTQSGKSVANLVVAVNDFYTQDVYYFKVAVWGKQAENCAQYLSKGRGVLVEGRLRRSQYEYKGEKRYSTEINANNVQFLSGGSSTKSSRNEESGDVPPFKEEPDFNEERKRKEIEEDLNNVNDEYYEEDDDIPF